MNYKLKYVTLRVLNLNTMLQFYTKVLGLNIVEQTETTALLGVGDNGFIKLQQEATVLRDKEYTGLYHVAILLPSEVDLGSLFHAFIKNKTMIQGASDHGFSQAVYLPDPEGNGIEVYADRPKEQWNMNPDGTIPAVTEAIDIHRLLDISKGVEWNGMPKGTVIGHVHLQVNSISKAKEFYLDTLGYNLMTEMSHAIFISKEGYHHDFGVNMWSGTNITPLPENMTGLKSVTLTTPNIEVMKEKFPNFKETDKGIEVTDFAGINLNFELK